MTDDMMTLRALIEKAPDADLLREMIGFAAHRLMELGVQGLTGAGWGEKTTERLVTKRLPRPWLGDAGRNGGAARLPPPLGAGDPRQLAAGGDPRPRRQPLRASNNHYQYCRFNTQYMLFPGE